MLIKQYYGQFPAKSAQFKRSFDFAQIDSNAAKALSGLVHITSSAESIIRPASLFPQEEDTIAATAAATSLMNILNSLTTQINAP